MPRYCIENGVRRAFTPEEETARDAEEKAWADGAYDRQITSLRSERNRLLAESDWTQMPDSTLTTEQQGKWRLYRQKLRDLPATASPTLDENGQLQGVTWPTTP